MGYFPSCGAGCSPDYCNEIWVQEIPCRCLEIWKGKVVGKVPGRAMGLSEHCICKKEHEVAV